VVRGYPYAISKLAEEVCTKRRFDAYEATILEGREEPEETGNLPRKFTRKVGVALTIGEVLSLRYQQTS